MSEAMIANVGLNFKIPPPIPLQFIQGFQKRNPNSISIPVKFDNFNFNLIIVPFSLITKLHFLKIFLKI